MPPEQLEPVLNTLVDHFVSDKSRPEMVAIGINTTREVCVRVPLAQGEHARGLARGAARACALYTSTSALAADWKARSRVRVIEEDGVHDEPDGLLRPRAHLPRARPRDACGRVWPHVAARGGVR